MIGLIKRTFNYLNKGMFTKRYKALVRPHLEYDNLTWYPNLKRHSVALEQVQRRATRLLEECKEMSYTEKLKYLEIEVPEITRALKGRWLREDLIEMYRNYNNLEDIEFQNLFSLAKSNKIQKC